MHLTSLCVGGFMGTRTVFGHHEQLPNQIASGVSILDEISQVIFDFDATLCWRRLAGFVGSHNADIAGHG